MKTHCTNVLITGVIIVLFSVIHTISYGQTSCSDYNVTSIPFSPVSGHGDTLDLGDDQLSLALPIGFNFNFYCNTYSQFRVSSNGFITFELAPISSGCCTGQSLPNSSQPNNLIACAWEDLNPSNGGTIEYFTTGIAPNRRLIVRYDNVLRFRGNTVSAEIVLHEGSNIIDIHSTEILTGPNDMTTQGIENMDGTAGLTVSGRNSSVWSSTAESYRFQAITSIYGSVYQDFNQNCIIDSNDINLAGRSLLINPGNIIVQTDNSGVWGLDSLPIGNYTITVDTSGPWLPTCPITQNFTVVHPDSLLLAPPFGFISTSPCPSPRVTINAPFLRPGFSNQRVYVQACNDNLATNPLDSGYVIIELDSSLTVQSSSLSYSSLGNNQYQVDLSTINTGNCIDFWLECTLSPSTILGQSICMSATLLPIDSCVLDNIPNSYLSNTISPCTLPWDHSSLQVTGSCVNDSVRFVIQNTGLPVMGDMDCYAPMRLYIDGLYTLLDSIQLAGGDSIVFMFDGNGQTIRLEADQHPLHPGNSHPNASIELCGNPTNWTSNLINTLPHDDANPFVDIFCGIARGSYDPNDKRGFPLGVGNNHTILPNQDLEYVIRFQNTGTDTAFTVVIRDTLAIDLDILSVHAGVSSHDYEFKMYGSRILEWAFNNIMLPDNTTNEPASNGFVTFTVQQVSNLPNNTIIENSAGIYFDFNPPIITNTSIHTVNEEIIILDITKAITKEMNLKVFPNPTQSYLTIVKENDQDINILILDNLGQVILSKQSAGKTTQLDISEFPAGIYYLSIHDGIQNAVQKIIKQ